MFLFDAGNLTKQLVFFQPARGGRRRSPDSSPRYEMQNIVCVSPFHHFRLSDGTWSGHNMRNPSVQHWLVEYYNSPRDSNSCSIVYFHEFIIPRAVRSDSVSGRLRRLLRTLQWNLCPYKTVAVQTSTDYCHLDSGLVCYHQNNVLNIRNIWSDGSFYYIFYI